MVVAVAKQYKLIVYTAHNASTAPTVYTGLMVLEQKGYFAYTYNHDNGNENDENTNRRKSREMLK